MDNTSWLHGLKHFLRNYGSIAFWQLLVFISIWCFMVLKEKTLVRKVLKNYPRNASYIAFGLIAVICFIVFRNYLLLKNAYLFWDINDDGYVFFYPKLYNLSNYIASHGLPKWSFRMGMGQNVFPFVLLDPFDVILYFTGKNSIPSLLIYVEVLKIVVAGAIFFQYLKLLRFSAYTCILGSLLYSFCSFITVGSPFFIFTFEAVNFALFLLAFELLFVKQKWFLFTFAVFLACISLPFDLYTEGLFLVFYAVFRHLQTGRFDLGKLSVLFAKMIGLGVLGILLSGPFLLENVMQLLNSPRGSGLTSYTHQLMSSPVFGLPDRLQAGTCIMRFFSNDILGSNSAYKGWFNYAEAPNFYCGLPCLLLLPQVFLFVEKRVRTVFIIFILLWLLPMIFPYFRYAFWLFAGDYYRFYSFFVAILLMYYSFYALDNIFRTRKINMPVLLFTAAVLIILLCFPVFISNKIIDNKVRVFVIITLIIYTVILAMVSKAANLAYLKYALLVTVVFELCYSVNITANNRGVYTMKALETRTKIPFTNYSYSDFSLDAVRYIQQRDSAFYRIDRAYDSSDVLNFGLVQGYNSTSCYNDLSQLYYIRYMQLMGVAGRNSERDSRWTPGLSNNPILESENSVKYFLLYKDNLEHLSPAVWDSLTTIGDVKIFKNKSLLPFGFTYGRFIKESDFEMASQKQKEWITLKAVVIADKDVNKIDGIKEYPLKDTMSGSLDSIASDIKDLRADSLKIEKFDDNYLAGTVNAGADKLMYLSIPFDDGWHLQVDGKEQEKVLLNGGMTGILLNKGQHTIRMFYLIRFLNIGLWMSFSGVILCLGLWYYIRSRN